MVGAILVGGAAMCAGGASRAAPTIGGFLDAAGFALAAEGDGGFSLAPTAGESFAADGLAIRTPGIDGDGSAGDDGVEATATGHAPAAPAADFGSGSTGGGNNGLSGALSDAIGFEVAPTPGSIADVRAVWSGVPVNPIDDLVAAPADADSAAPASAATDDIMVEVTVPALAAFGLLAAGLLALGVVRRSRRAAAARRIKLGLDPRRRALRP